MSFREDGHAAVDWAADYLDRAQKVTILGGAGCEGAHTQLMALAAKLKSVARKPEPVEIGVR